MTDIVSPAPLVRDEHILEVHPRPATIVDAGWRRRVNPSPGRKLDATALAQAQVHAAEAQRLLASGLSPGVVRGLGVTPLASAAGDRFAVQAGLGLTHAGEDVVIDRAIELDVMDMQLCLPAALLAAWSARMFPPAAGVTGRPPPGLRVVPSGPIAGAPAITTWPDWALGPRLADLAAAPELADAPRLAILVAEPATLEAVIPDRSRANRPEAFAADVRDEPFDDQSWIDGCRFSLFLWPAALVPPTGVDAPGYGLPATGDPAFRNMAAHALFSMERGFQSNDMHPWERLGVPLALVGFDAAWRVAFVDRAAVVRAGGLARRRTPLVGNAGSPFLWQARVSQFVAQFVEEDDGGVALGDLHKRFPRLPPAGMLTRRFLDAAAKEQRFFPPAIITTLAPLPLDQVERVIAESSSLRPLALASPEPIDVLLPVPGDRYDPDLLEKEEPDRDLETRVAELSPVRDAMFATRQAARRIVDLHAAALAGRTGGWPDRDRDEADGERTAPLGCRRFRRFSGAQKHALDVPGGLALSTEDQIFAWVRADAKVKTVSLGKPKDADVAGVVWSRAEGAQDVLPKTTDWVRLVAPAKRLWEVLPEAERKAGRVESLIFGQVSESDGPGTVVLWGPCGLVARDGGETEWISDDPPAGAAESVPGGAGGWTWVDAGPDDGPSFATPDFGIVMGADGRRESEALRSAAAAFPFAGATGWKALVQRGLPPLLDSVGRQVDRLDDLIDAGFLRSRADIVRVRQLMLGESDAESLSTSPALSDIIRKETSALGVSEKLGAFIKEMKKDFKVAQPAPVEGVTAGMVRGDAVRSFAFETQPSVLALRSDGFRTNGFKADMVKVGAFQEFRTDDFTLPVSKPPIAELVKPPARRDDIVQQRPIGAAIERSISVAERLRDPDSGKAWAFAVDARVRLVQDLFALMSGDVFLDDIEIDGLVKTAAVGNKPAVNYTLGDLRKAEDKAKIDTALRTLGVATDAAPSAQFNAAIRVVDDTVALLRQLEARVGQFRSLLGVVEAARAAGADALQRAKSALAAADLELSEARHDVAVGQALLAEERARAAAVNRRRQETLERHVPYLVFRRRRVAERDYSLALMEASPAADERPQVQCREAHDDAPEELREMVETFRNAPALWFPALAGMIDRIADVPSLAAALAADVASRPLPQVRRAADLGRGKVGLALAGAIGLHGEALAVKAAAKPFLAPSLIGSLGLAAARERYRAQVTVGQLMAGAHATPAAGEAAGKLLARLTQLAACLHESLESAPARLRLAWAEQLSAFDEPVRLRQLSVLSGWTSQSGDGRREQQGLADALHRMVDPGNEEAARAIGELVRVAVLLSAHAPASAVIAARAVATSRPVVGGLIDLRLNLDGLRLGVDVVMREPGGGMIARAVVADIVDGVARARFTRVDRADAAVTPATYIHVGRKLQAPSARSPYAKVFT